MYTMAHTLLVHEIRAVAFADGLFVLAVRLLLFFTLAHHVLAVDKCLEAVRIASQFREYLQASVHKCVCAFVYVRMLKRVCLGVCLYVLI